MTVHKAKGLEKKVVLIPYCNWPLDPKTGGGANNVVWAAPRTEQAETAPLAALGEFPVRYKRTMGESLFSEAYYRELVYTHVDNINLLYVALTRAVEVLCIFIPQSQRGANVGSLLLQSLGHDGDVARLGSTTGRYTAGEAGETFEFGVAAAPEPEEEQSAERPLHVVLDDYPTTVPDLRLRLPSDRYFEQGEEVELAPRNLGILMHRAFENAATREEIDDNIRRAVADAALSPADAEALAAAIGRQFDDPLVAGWFDGGWNIVRNENEIIVPHRTRIRRTRREQTVERTIRRPDRVMVKEGRAVVVDYKFGLRENPDHRRQLGEYIELLREIGYTQVEGYLWYVRMERIVSIDG